MDKPYAPATDRNRDPILEILRRRFADRRSVLEIGSGTGQHAVYFAAALPWLNWQTSDVSANLPGIRLWLEGAALPNTPAPIPLDVCLPWPTIEFDAVFTANTLHIMGWEEVEGLFAALNQQIQAGGLLTVYGPFNQEGRFTSESNAKFDAMLRAGNPASGLRDFAAVNDLATKAGLHLLEDCPMPANNRCIIWQRADPSVTR